MDLSKCDSLVEFGDAVTTRIVMPGDYVEVLITDVSSQSLRGVPVAITTLQRGISNQPMATVTHQ